MTEIPDDIRQACLRLREHNYHSYEVQMPERNDGYFTRDTDIKRVVEWIILDSFDEVAG